MEGHLRALLRDVLCGYLDSDLKGVADDILLETSSEPFAPAEEQRFGEVEAHDMRVKAAPVVEPEPEPAASAEAGAPAGRDPESSRSPATPPRRWPPRTSTSSTA